MCCQELLLTWNKPFSYEVKKIRIVIRIIEKYCNSTFNTLGESATLRDMSEEQILLNIIHWVCRSLSSTFEPCKSVSHIIKPNADS